MAGDDDHPARRDVKVGHGGAPGIACWHLGGYLWASEKVVLFARHQDQKTVIRLSDELVNEIISIVASWSWRPWPWSTCGLHLPLS